MGHRLYHGLALAFLFYATSRIQVVQCFVRDSVSMAADTAERLARAANRGREDLSCFDVSGPGACLDCGEVRGSRLFFEPNSSENRKRCEQTTTTKRRGGLTLTIRPFLFKNRTKERASPPKERRLAGYQYSAWTLEANNTSCASKENRTKQRELHHPKSGGLMLVFFFPLFSFQKKIEGENATERRWELRELESARACSVS